MKHKLLHLTRMLALLLVISQVALGQNLTIVYPNGGEKWEVGKTPCIKWQTSSTEAVTLEYAIDNGLHWNFIATVPANHNNYVWTIPATLSDKCIVRATSGKNVDTSDAPFSIIPNSGETYRIAILGSSTAAGTGPTNVNNAWVWMYRDYLTQLDTRYEVINYALGGTTTYNILPTGTAIPSNVNRTVDTERNITKALAQNPNGIIINMPSNDAASNYPALKQMANYKLIQNTATAQNVPIFVASPQPRNFQNPTQLAIQLEMRKLIDDEFNSNSFDFWSELAMPNGDINPLYNSGDGIHLNNAGHQILLKKIVESGIHTKVKAIVDASWKKK